MSDFNDMIEAMKKDKEGGKSKKFWSPPSDKEGTFPIRILPPLKDKGEKVFYFHHRVHWINSRSYECLKQSYTDKNGTFHEAEECPICKFVSKLYSTAEKGSDEWELAGKLRAQDRYIYRVIVRGKEVETEPEFYESGKSIFEILYHIIAETDFGNITDNKTGRDFALSKKGSGRRAKYETSTASANSTPVFTKADDIRAFSESFKKMDYNSLIESTDSDTLRKALKAFLEGDNDDDSSSDKEEVIESKPKQAAAKTKQPEPEPEVPDEDVDDQIDDILNNL